jgi:hypothetical protein
MLIRHVLEETEENCVKPVRLAKPWAEILKGKHPHRKKICNPHDGDV